MRTIDGTHDGVGASERPAGGDDTRTTTRGVPGGTLEAFATELGGMWPAVRHRCVALDTDELDALSVRLERHLLEHPTLVDRIGELANDLMALMAGWPHFGEEERAVLVGAMDYLASEDDLVPDGEPGGLEDDDLVVGAAVRAVLRRHRSAA